MNDWIFVHYHEISAGYVFGGKHANAIRRRPDFEGDVLLGTFPFAVVIIREVWLRLEGTRQEREDGRS